VTTSYYVAVRWIVVLAVVAACTSTPRGAWERVAAGVYLYPETIDRYAPDDRGGYVVHPRAGASAADRAALVAAIATDPDDVIDDGVVVRLTEAERARIAARPDVGGVDVLQPAARRGVRAGDDARIDLFGGASDAERDAVAAWLERRGATVTWRGPAALRALVSDEVRAAAARVGPVRWVE